MGRMKKKKIKKISAFRMIIMLLLLLLSFTYIYMLFWTILTAVKDIDDFMHNFFGLPGKFAWDNLLNVVENFKVTVRDAHGIPYEIGIPQMMKNTIVYVVCCGFSSTLVPFLTAYLISMYDYKFSKILYGFVIVAMGIPIVGSQAATVVLLQDLGLYDTQLALVLMKASIISMYFLIMVATFQGIPYSMVEAAEMDGASQFRTMVQVVMPMARNVFWTVFLINCIGLWNEYNSVYLYQPNHPTLAVGLYKLINTSTQNMSYPPLRAAACLALMLPVLILFIFFHDKMMSNLSMGGVKE